MGKDGNDKRDVRDVLRTLDKMIDLIIDDEEIEDYRPLVEKIQDRIKTINEDIEQKRKDNEETFGFAPLHFLTLYPNQLESMRT